MKYGGRGKDRNTIHATEYLDIETSRNGKVIAVWFRCTPLPFKQTFVKYDRVKEMRDLKAPALISVEIERN